MHEPMNTCAKMTDATEIASYTYHSDLDTKVYDRIRGLVANWKARPSRSQRELLHEYLSDDVEMRMVLDALRSRYANIANHCHIITGRVHQDLAKITNAINGATRLSYGAWLINVPLYVRVYNESNTKLTRLYDYLEKTSKEATFIVGQIYQTCRKAGEIHRSYITKAMWRADSIEHRPSDESIIYFLDKASRIEREFNESQKEMANLLHLLLEQMNKLTRRRNYPSLDTLHDRLLDFTWYEESHFFV